MQHPQSSPSTAGKHVPFTKGGWGVAIFICLLAVASAASAYYVHRSTYRPPTDVRFHAVGSTRGHE